METQIINPRKGQKILLLDYDYDQVPEFKRIFNDYSFIKLKQRELEIKLLNMLREISFDLKTTLLICVGQSSLELYHRLSGIDSVIERFNMGYAHGQRIYEDITLPDGKNSYKINATVGKVANIKTGIRNTDIKTVIVIDDVISTGITLRTLHERNSMYFPNSSSWRAFSLVSRLGKVKNYTSISTACLVVDKSTPINTFSKLVEDIVISANYMAKHVDLMMLLDSYRLLINFNKQCLFSPHVFCFDLYNTLVKEIKMGLKGNDYLDYFVEKYGREYSFTKESVYSYVRDRLMSTQHDNFEGMTECLYREFVPDVACTTRIIDNVPNLVERYWRFGSDSVEWISETYSQKLKKLRELGHKVVLITNYTFPAWKKVNKKLEIEKLFDYCFVSSIEGISKPDENVWKKVEEKFPEFPRNKFVMIGDNPIDDLEIPEKRGWRTINADKLSPNERDRIFVL